MRLVTHILNSTLGLLVFSMERKFLKNVEDSSGIEWMRGRAASRSNPLPINALDTEVTRRQWVSSIAVLKFDSPPPPTFAHAWQP